MSRRWLPSVVTLVSPSIIGWVVDRLRKSPSTRTRARTRTIAGTISRGMGRLHRITSSGIARRRYARNRSSTIISMHRVAVGRRRIRGVRISV